MSYPIVKPFEKTTSKVVLAGTIDTITLVNNDTAVKLKSLTIDSPAPISSITIDNSISITPATSVDLQSIFGELVFVSQIDVVIDNSGGTLDHTISLKVSGVERV